MEMVVEKVGCSTCKHGMCQHKRYYTYDNRMIEFYQWKCTKERNKRETSPQIHECELWENG